MARVAVGVQSSIESRAIYAAYIGGGVGFVTALVSFWGRDISLFSRGLSLGFVGSILGGIVGLVTFLVVSAKLDDRVEKSSLGQYVKDNITTWSLALVHGLLVFVTYALLFYIVNESFRDAYIDVWAASAIIALSTGFAAYIVFLSGSTMTAVRVAMLLALFLLSGTFISMMTANDPHWWYLHFSSLGAGGGVSGYAFNGTLIIAGLVIIALSRYITQDFNQLKHDEVVSQEVKVGILQTLLIGIGLGLAGVGAFVYNEFPTIHNSSAGGMAVLFLAIVVLLPILTPGFTRAFFVASYSLLGALLVSVWLFVRVHYLNLTMFELLAAAIIFTWLVMFVRHVAAVANDEAVGAARHVTKKTKEGTI